MLAAATAFLAVAAVTACAAPQAAPDESQTEYATPVDLMNARVDCLEDKGWTVEVDAESVQFSVNTVSDEEQLKLEQDDLDCYEELGYDPNRTLTADEFDELYDQYRDAAECLRGEGFEISDAPSRQVFAETYYSDAWLPWDQVDEASFNEALDACPMPPPVL
ncbi:hypothetical protein ACI7YT_10085 [Microbacterium sp. M]|uniref:hypothetical protein n=1 Tax=Microbacterium sp. M TaxID=3377125 RepID=UPI003865461B